MARWPKIILFGDSHTQRSFDPANGCWGALLANHFQRICDIVPRGFSGYNTRYCRIIQSRVFEALDASEVACIVILLGSNDSNDPSSPTGQHVPLEEYTANLEAIMNYFETCRISKDRLILMTPPNYFHERFVAECRAQGRINPPVNSNENVGQYAEACRKVATKHKVTCLDLFHLFSTTPDSSHLFVDGLHLSQKGGELLFKQLKPLLIEKVERFLGKPIELAMHFPYWNEIDSKNPEKSLQDPPY